MYSVHTVTCTINNELEVINSICNAIYGLYFPFLLLSLRRM